MPRDNERLYYVEYSRKMVAGGRLQLCGVWKQSTLAEYLINYSERYDYVIESAHIATLEEIQEFSSITY